MSEQSSTTEISELSPTATLLGHTSWSLRCAISGDGEVGISGDGKPSARLWNLSDITDSTPFGNGKVGIRQCCLNFDGSMVAIAGSGSKNGVQIFNSKSGKKLYEMPVPSKGMSPSGCALSPDSSVLAASFRSANRSKGSIRVVKWRENTPVASEIDRPYSIWQVMISSDTRRLAYKFWHGTTSGVELIDPWNDRLFFTQPMPPSEWAFSMDSSASVIATATEWSLRVTTLDERETVKTLPGYTFSAYADCSVSADGNYVVAPVRDHKFGVWHIPSGALVHILVGHTDRTNGCSISADASRIITCSNDRSVRLWELLDCDATSVVEETAADDPIILKTLYLMLDGRYNFSLTSDTLRSVIVAENINSVTDLFFAHSVLIISKRTIDLVSASQIPKEQIENLYGCISGRLHSPLEALMAQLIMLHAEQLELLSEGFAYKTTGVAMNASKQMVDDLKSTLLRCWRLAFSLPKRKNHEKLEKLLLQQLNSVYDEIESIRSNEHVMIFAAIARCTLLFHPEYLTTLEDFTFGISGTIPVSDLLRESKLTGITFIEKICPFDISSPKVLKALLSRDFISILSPDSKRCVLSAVSNSFFKNENIAQAYLHDIISLKLNRQNSADTEEHQEKKKNEETDPKNEKRKENGHESDLIVEDVDGEHEKMEKSLGFENNNSNPVSKNVEEVVGVWEKSASLQKIDPKEEQSQFKTSDSSGIKNAGNASHTTSKDQTTGRSQIYSTKNLESDVTEKIEIEEIEISNETGKEPAIHNQGQYIKNTVKHDIRSSVTEIASRTNTPTTVQNNESSVSGNDSLFKPFSIPQVQGESSGITREAAPESESKNEIFENGFEKFSEVIENDHSGGTKNNHENILVSANGSNHVELQIDSSSRTGDNIVQNRSTEKHNSHIIPENDPTGETHRSENQEPPAILVKSELTDKMKRFEKAFEGTAAEAVSRNNSINDHAVEEEDNLIIKRGDSLLSEHTKSVEENRVHPSTENDAKPERPQSLFIESQYDQSISQSRGSVKEIHETKSSESPQVMNINVYIVTEDQKAPSANETITEVKSEGAKSFELAKTVSSSYSEDYQTEFKDQSKKSSESESKELGASDSADASQSGDSSKGVKSKDKKHKRSKLRKSFISLAKGTRNTFYGKKKTKEEAKGS